MFGIGHDRSTATLTLFEFGVDGFNGVTRCGSLEVTFGLTTRGSNSKKWTSESYFQVFVRISSWEALHYWLFGADTMSGELPVVVGGRLATTTGVKN